MLTKCAHACCKRAVMLLQCVETAAAWCRPACDVPCAPQATELEQVLRCCHLNGAQSWHRLALAGISCHKRRRSRMISERAWSIPGPRPSVVNPWAKAQWQSASTCLVALVM